MMRSLGWIESLRTSVGLDIEKLQTDISIQAGGSASTYKIYNGIYAW